MRSRHTIVWIVPATTAAVTGIFLLLPVELADNPAVIALLAALPAGAGIYVLMRELR